jgi:nucleoside-diphosphate-sugar epimerase
VDAGGIIYYYTVIQSELSGKRILVTGGTGFIGGRLIERLVLEHGAKVRVLVHNFARASRIARFPVEMVRGDITEARDLEAAVRDCDIVYHCACATKGSPEFQRFVNVDGAKNVFEAAQRAGVQRVVYLSTVMVYGPRADGDLDETAARKYFGFVYADSKVDAEAIAFDYARNRNLPVTILQPTTVYGPFAAGWTINVLQQLKTGRVVLVNGGDGLCNLVYVDDVVNAMMLSAVNPKAVGEAFLISGTQPITWREFYSGYERMLGFSSTVSMSAEEAGQRPTNRKHLLSEMWSILRESPVRRRLLNTQEAIALKNVTRSVLPANARNSLRRSVTGSGANNGNGAGPAHAGALQKPVILLDATSARFIASKIRVRIDKAERLLGYHPRFDFESGLKLTEEWARWANLL